MFADYTSLHPIENWWLNQNVLRLHPWSYHHRREQIKQRVTHFLDQFQEPKQANALLHYVGLLPR